MKNNQTRKSFNTSKRNKYFYLNYYISFFFIFVINLQNKLNKVELRKSKGII